MSGGTVHRVLKETGVERRMVDEVHFQFLFQSKCCFIYIYFLVYGKMMI